MSLVTKRHFFSISTGIVIAVFLLVPIANAQDTRRASDTLGVRHQFNEIVVTATRSESRLFEIPRAMSVLDRDEIDDRAISTTPDALGELPGIMTQKTNAGGGSPFIRGLTGKQVLILIDDVRFNNSTFRFGPNQYLNTVDPYTISRLEVVYGPGSVLYGSDALGGVVHIRTRSPWESIRHGGGTTLSPRIYQRLSSADRGSITRVDVEGSIDRIGYSVGGTYKHFGNLRAGSGSSPVGAIDVDGYQPATAYTEGDFNAFAEVALSPDSRLRAAVLFSRQDNVPRSDRLIATDNRPDPHYQYAFDPQEMLLGYVAYEKRPQQSLLGSVRANLSVNRQSERRRIRRNEAAPLSIEDDDILTVGGGLQASSRQLGRSVLTTGVEVYHDDVSSSRRLVATDGSETTAFGRFPDGATYSTFGAFAQNKVTVSPVADITMGVRYSRFATEADFGDLTIEPVGVIGSVSAAYSDLTYTVEAMLRPSEEVRLYASVARGFRAPNLDDLAVNGDWSSGEDIPNPDVKPEQVVQIEVGIKADIAGHAYGGISVFAGLFEDLIQRAEVAEGLFRFENVATARIYGGEVFGRWLVAVTERASYSVQGHASYAWGSNRTDDEPIRRIPPAMGLLRLRVEPHHVKIWGEADVRGALRQDRLSGGDITDVRIPAGGTPGWASVAVRAGYRVTKHVSMTVAVENLTNERYRIHGSGIDAPGFNAMMGVDARF